MTTITERVERGAALLDEKRPGWWRDIDLDALDIQSRCSCVLGQIGSSVNRHFAYGDGLEMVGLEGWQARGYGFDSCTDIDERRLAEQYAALTGAWRDLITGRRELAGVSA